MAVNSPNHLSVCNTAIEVKPAGAKDDFMNGEVLSVGDKREVAERPFLPQTSQSRQEIGIVIGMT